MRSVLAIAVLAACDKGPPDPERYRAMTEEQKCEATEPRAKQCIDDLLVAQMRAVVDDEQAAGAIERDLRRPWSTDQHDAADVHRTMCRGDRGYADAVVACWGESSCEAFAKCFTAYRR